MSLRKWIAGLLCFGLVPFASLHAEDFCKSTPNLEETLRRFDQGLCARQKQQEKQRQVQEAVEEESRNRQLEADLRSGRRAPENWRQCAVAKGLDKKPSTEVMFPALVSPKGEGLFVGKVSQIDGQVIYLTGGRYALDLFGFNTVESPENSVVTITKNTRLFDPGQIRVGANVAGNAVQARAQSVQLVNGASSTIAVMQATCMGPF